MKADGIPFMATTGSKTGKSWAGNVRRLSLKQEPYELEITGRGSRFHVIIGTYVYGNFVCIPNRSVGSGLSELQDVFWNREQLYHNTSLNKTDASTVACGIAAASAQNLV